MDVSISEMLSVAVEAAREAGETLLERLQTDIRISKKGRTDLVTEMDLKSEKIIVDRIRRSFSDHQILAEEGGSLAGKAPYKWVIDPLDGTTNYAHGYRFFSVSIALEMEDQLVLGVVYDPVTDELFTAERGRGARLNGKPIHVSDQKALIDSLLCTGFSYHQQQRMANLEYFGRFLTTARAVRRDGSAALDLCYVACGRFEALWELTLHPWDVAGGKIIVEEAGGRVTRFDGTPCTIYEQEILATNGRIHDQVLRILQGGESAE